MWWGSFPAPGSCAADGKCKLSSGMNGGLGIGNFSQHTLVTL
jgi:hypothetical protein